MITILAMYKELNTSTVYSTIHALWQLAHTLVRPNNARVKVCAKGGEVEEWCKGGGGSHGAGGGGSRGVGGGGSRGVGGGGSRGVRGGVPRSRGGGDPAV